MANDTIVEQMVPSGLLTGIKFDLMTGGDVEKFSDANIVETSDVTSPKLGLPNASSHCATCGSRNIRDCDGHFGVIKLPTTIYHPYLVSEVVQILNQICPGCQAIKQDIRKKGSFTSKIKNKSIGKDPYSLEALCKNLSYVDRQLLLKLAKSKLSLPIRSVLARAMKIHDNFLKKRSKTKMKKAAANNQEGCKYCSRNATESYPAIKFKISPKDIQGQKILSIVAEVNENVPKKFQNKGLSEVPNDYWNFTSRYSNQKGTNMKKISLSPSQTFGILKQLDKGFIEEFVSRRELLFLSCLPVTPNCHRVMETSRPYSDGPQLSYDERTKAYKRVVDLSRKIGEFQQHEQFGVLAPSYTADRVLDYLNASKLRSNNSLVEDHPSCKTGMKWLKDVVLSKRSDNSFRMVMVGDPKIRLGEIGVPHDIAENLFVAEHVNCHNLNKLNQTCNLHLLIKEELLTRKNGHLTSVRKANQLQIGDIFYRPLENGDIVLVNRPPSVHQHSLIALSVKILPIQSVISINPLCCAPLLGDFDGDCIHGYVPQSVRCRVELGELVSLDHQLLNVQDGRSLLSLTHDSLTAAHLLTATEVFFNKFEIQQLEMLCRRELPSPAIVKSLTLQSPLWTGQQLFSLLLPPSMDYCVGSRKLQITEGEILSSPGMSFWLQNTTGSIFSSMFKFYGKKALDFLFPAQDVLCEYLTMTGLSVSLADVYLSSDTYSRTKLIDEVSYGLQEAEYACKTKQLMLDPQLEFHLKSHDESEDPSQCINHNFGQNKTHISHVSASAFKDVFHDLQNAILQYTSKDNSMLMMINAGSKGSLLKLVQQGACVGLQLSASSLPFEMPYKLSCVQWNQQKALNWCVTPEDSVDHAPQRDFFAVIATSFLDGLNPLESFVHALSGRANLFSENAAVPGTLTRKLMFYMRDIYLAYDGTVRSAYGQQIVQFQYDFPEQHSNNDGGSLQFSGEKGSGGSEVGGQPVGSWSACSISEAAYGAADQPMSSLEASPLMNLKKVLECGRPRKSAHQTASIFLSKKLERWNYGFEYGALEVKNHLERVFFSDVVTTVMIVYGGHEVEGTKFGPWISHFHLSKERMLKKRLTIEQIVDELMRNYNSMRVKMNTLLPSLFIMSKDCLLVDVEKKHDDIICIRVLFETSKSDILLDTIKDIVIPVLLQTLIKGFLEVKKVAILSDTQPDYHGGLFLKITLAENYLWGKVWSVLQNACIPIIDLIDWECSRPDDIYDIYIILGIDAAWRYFLHSLKSTTTDIGRDISREHLLMLADSLSVTGQFHGLSFKGLKRHRDHASVPSPFSQACFSNPSNHFINAAKKGSTDNLCGTLDAIAWGKEAPIGTGGPFEIIYSGKVHIPKKVDSIYKTLHSLSYDKTHQDHCKISTPDQNIFDKWEKPMVANAVASTKGSRLFNRDCTQVEEQASLGFKSKFVSHNVGSGYDVVNMCSSLRTILHGYPINEHLNEADKSSVMEALSYHPKGDAKMGSGIHEIKVGHSPDHPGTRCFILIRKDGTIEDFSYRKCVIGAAYQISLEFGLMVEKKLHHGRRIHLT